MTEMQIAMVQDASKDAALAGLSLRQIVAMAGAASIAQTPASTEMFARLADGDATGIGPLFIPPRIRGDGKAEVSAFGACMGDAIAETDVAILSSEKIAPGDLCQLVVRGGFGSMVKQYLGQWGGDYQPFSDRTSEKPGYLFFQCRPATFLIVHPDDLLGATRVVAVKRSGVETGVRPWHVDVREDTAFADFFNSLPVNEMGMPSVSLEKWPSLMREAAIALGSFLWSRSEGRQ